MTAFALIRTHVTNNETATLSHSYFDRASFPYSYSNFSGLSDADSGDLAQRV